MPKGDLIIQYLSRKGSGLNGKSCIDCCSHFNRNIIRFPSVLSCEDLLYQNAFSMLHRFEADVITAQRYVKCPGSYPTL